MPGWIEVFALVGALIALGAMVMTVANLLRLPIPDGGSGETIERRLSVAIPARNEAKNIEECIRSVLGGGVAGVRVLVYDDQSDDGTGGILERMARSDERITIIPTQPMPSGWCGKQHACWRLAQHA